MNAKWGCNVDGSHVVEQHTIASYLHVYYYGSCLHETTVQAHI